MALGVPTVVPGLSTNGGAQHASRARRVLHEPLRGPGGASAALCDRAQVPGSIAKGQTAIDSQIGWIDRGDRSAFDLWRQRGLRGLAVVLAGGFFSGTFDPLDIVAYGLSVGLCYLADKRSTRPAEMPLESASSPAA